VADVDWLGPGEYLAGRRAAKLVHDPAFHELVQLRILSERCASERADCCSEIAGVWGDCIHDTARRIVYPKLGWEPV
jgi:hypothetical protein